MEAIKLKPRSQPFELSLRIRHPSLDPAVISRELGIEAEHSFRAGDPRPSRSGLTPTSVHADSYWLGALQPAEWPAQLPIALQPLMQLTPERLGVPSTRSLGWALSLHAARFFKTHAQFLQRIRADGATLSLLVTIAAAAASHFSLVPEASRVFSELGIVLEFEFATL